MGKFPKLDANSIHPSNFTFTLCVHLIHSCNIFYTPLKLLCTRWCWFENFFLGLSFKCMLHTQSLIFRLTERAAVCLRGNFIVKTNHVFMILRPAKWYVTSAVMDSVNKDKSLNALVLECTSFLCTLKKHFNKHTYNILLCMKLI